MIVAVDGPSASGKGTIARAIAARLGLPHLDTGLLYRAVGVRTIEAGIALDDLDGAANLARALAEELAAAPRLLEAPALRTDRAAHAASRIAALPPVRTALLDLQRTFARQPGGAVLDGRDIGTVVAPDADVKLYVDARAEVRALRRFRELADNGQAMDYQAVLSDIRQRDSRDSSRSSAPLACAADAHRLDTSDMDVEAAIRAALRLVEAGKN